MSSEIWKPISLKKYNKTYEVSSLGRIRRVKTQGGKSICRILNYRISSEGYATVMLYSNNVGKTYRVHRLVASAFLDNQDNLPVVHHIDHNKVNNHVENLMWCSTKFNSQSQNRDREKASFPGEKNQHSKLTEEDVRIIRLLWKRREKYKRSQNVILSQKQIAEWWNVSAAVIHQIIRQKAWKHIE